MDVALGLIILAQIGMSAENITPDEIIGGNTTVINQSYLTPSPMDIAPDEIIAETSPSSNSTAADYWINRCISLLNNTNKDKPIDYTKLYNHIVENNISDEDAKNIYLLAYELNLKYDLLKSKERVHGTIEKEWKDYYEFLEWIVYNETNQELLDGLKDQKEIYQAALELNAEIFLELSNYSAANGCIDKAIEIEKAKHENDQVRLESLLSTKIEALENLQLPNQMVESYENQIKIFEEKSKTDSFYGLKLLDVRFHLLDYLINSSDYEKVIQVCDDLIYMEPRIETFEREKIYRDKCIALEALGRTTEANAACTRAEELRQNG